MLSLFQLITSALLNNSVFFVNIQGNHIFQWFQVEKDYNMSKTPYVDAVSTSLPSVLSDLLTSFDAISLDKLETLIRFCTGATCPPRIAGHAGAWTSGQTRAQSQLSVLNQKTGEKRNRPDDEVGEAGTSTANGSGAPSKKQKLGLTDSADDSKALYTLHSVSVAAPIRKKVDISIRKEAIHLSNPSSGSLEARISVESITRAFLVSTLARNKNKEQWMVVLLSADSFDKKSESSDHTQVMFSIDKDVPAGKEGFKTTSGLKSQVTHSKGDPTLPLLQEFLACLPSHIKVITADKGSQVFSSSSGQPYVDAYRGAKEGTLVFTEHGILWGNARPCEFFALEDLSKHSESPVEGGVKTLSATGRTFTVFVRRRASGEDVDEEGEDEDEDDDQAEEEIEIAMIDGKEKEKVDSWIRKYKHLFGKQKGSPVVDKKGKGKALEEPVPDFGQDELDSDGDEDDEDFAPDESDGGEPSDDSDSDEAESAEEGGLDNDDDDNGDDDDDENEDDEIGDDEAENLNADKLDPAHHPLLRPGAMPKMSKAALEAVVNMVEGDLENNEDEEEEEDELALE